MRIVKILLFLLTIGQAAFATDIALAKILTSLSANQKTLLYQYGTLNTWATPVEADSFWRQHQSELGNISPDDGKLLGSELLANTELVYAMKTPSRLQALRGVFTASRLLLGLAGLVGAFALLQLFGRYIPGVWRRLVLYFSPLFRRLFSPRMLSWEMLAVSLAAVYFGVMIPDVVLRTVVIQIGLVTIWTQLTAILTRQHHVKEYSSIIKDSFDDYYPAGRTFIHVSVPAILTSLVVLWVMRVCPDVWYRYEVMVPVMIGIFALPPLRHMESVLSRLIFPFPDHRIRVKDRRLAAYAVISLGVWMVLLQVILPESLLMLSVFLTGLCLLLSIADITRGGIKNYWWMQALTLLFLCAEVLEGSKLGMLWVAWTGLGGILIFVFIKYWELPVMLGWSWKNKRAWGALGMALLIWGIAVLIRARPEWFAIFPG
ncbi:hypothetical protein [Chitinophaga sp.]|uniref:hypothetical protein n=1 Tax=Chitinophaga sp. TaxID=1869181 RepID=UPI002F95E2FA